MTNKSPTGSFVCVCGHDFGSEMELEEHAREAHSATVDDVEQFTCPECGSNFATYSQLQEHWPAHGAPPDRPGHAAS